MKFRKHKRNHTVALTMCTTATLLLVAGFIASLPDLIKLYRIKTM